MQDEHALPPGTGGGGSRVCWNYDRHMVPAVADLMQEGRTLLRRPQTPHRRSRLRPVGCCTVSDPAMRRAATVACAVHYVAATPRLGCIRRRTMRPGFSLHYWPAPLAPRCCAVVQRCRHPFTVPASWAGLQDPAARRWPAPSRWILPRLAVTLCYSNSSFTTISSS
jgi:hypothetical protein